MSAEPRVLLSLPMFPFDPANGAAQSQRTTAEMLARQGFPVHVVANTVSARGRGHASDAIDPIESLRLHGVQAAVADRPRRFEFTREGVSFEVLDTGHAGVADWERAHGRAFTARFEAAVDTFRPDLLFSFTASPNDRARHAYARRKGARIVFALRHSQYFDRDLLRTMDSIMTPCQFTTDQCLAASGAISTPLPMPLDWDQVESEERDPIFFLIVNPGMEKGLMLIVRLADALGKRRPDIPLLIVESRSGAGHLLKAAAAGGLDLAKHENIMISGPVAAPKHLFAPTKVLLMPSLDEQGGRTAAEALVNGVPPVVSNRGGLAETAGDGGIVVDIPESITTALKVPVDTAVVEPWLALIERFEDDAAFLADWSARARASAERFHPSRLAPLYAEFFRNAAR